MIENGPEDGTHGHTEAGQEEQKDPGRSPGAEPCLSSWKVSLGMAQMPEFRPVPLFSDSVDQ